MRFKMGVSRNGGGGITAYASPSSEIRSGNGQVRNVIPPNASPAEVVRIAPENLEIANVYLQYQSIPEVADKIGVSSDIITEVLNRRDVKAYIDNIFLDYGFNNRFRMRQIMDAVINKKLEEMDDAGIGSNKDIMEIMALSHKMAMDTLDRQIKLEEAQAKNQHIKNQVNVQVNNADGGGSRYEQLIQRLMKGE